MMSLCGDLLDSGHNLQRRVLAEAHCTAQAAMTEVSMVRMFARQGFVLTCLFSTLAAGAIPTRGPYNSGTKQYNVSILDKSYPVLHVIWPENAPDGMTFPLLSYAHGAAGGSWYSIEGYYSLWTQIASYGFVVVAPASCSMGCEDGGWSTYYLEQLKCIDWARNQSKIDPILAKIDWDMGVGIVGHSMGGQATVHSAKSTYTIPRNITAAVLHHPEVDNGGHDISVPLAVQ